MLYLVSGLHKTLPVKRDYYLNGRLWARGVSPYPAEVVKERPQKRIYTVQMGLNFNFKSTKAQFLSVLCNLAIKKGQFEYQSIN